MAKLTTTITKKENDPWILLNDSSLFTQEELDTVVNPYFDYIKQLSGLVPNSYTQQINGNEFVYSLEFDTQDNANVAKVKIWPTSQEPIVKAKNKLLSAKMNGVVYTVVSAIE